MLNQPVITPTSQELSEDNLEKNNFISTSKLKLIMSMRHSIISNSIAISNRHSVISKFKFQIIRFMHHDRQNWD